MWLKLTDRLARMGGGPSGSAHMLGSCRYRIVAAALAAAVVILVAPAGAYAAPPKITSAPVIRGTAQVAGTLTASAVWTGQPEPTAAWQWLRCASAGESCAPIATATTDRYTPTTADVGSVLRVNLDRQQPAGLRPGALRADGGRDRGPGADGDARADRLAGAHCATGRVRGDAGANADAAACDEPSREPAVGSRLLRPVPLIRIKGVLTASGARITLLTVRARAARGSSSSAAGAIARCAGTRPVARSAGCRASSVRCGRARGSRSWCSRPATSASEL